MEEANKLSNQNESQDSLQIVAALSLPTSDANKVNYTSSTQTKIFVDKEVNTSEHDFLAMLDDGLKPERED